MASPNCAVSSSKSNGCLSLRDFEFLWILEFEIWSVPWPAPLPTKPMTRSPTGFVEARCLVFLWSLELGVWGVPSSFPRYRLVQVQQHAGNSRPGSELYRFRISFGIVFAAQGGAGLGRRPFERG